MFTDKLSQRILASFIGVSTLVMSIAMLLFVTQQSFTAQAEELDLQKPMDWDEGLRGAAGLGIKDNTAYFVVWSDPNRFYKVNLDKATDWYSE